MNRAGVTLIALLVLSAIQFVAFPVDLSVGDSWEIVTKRLRLVPRLPCAVGFAHESPVASEVFLLPDLTCVELVARPGDDPEGRFVLKSILTGPRFRGYPGKFRWLDDDFARSRSTLSLSGYTFPRLIAYLCLGVIAALGYRKLKQTIAA